MHWRSVAEWSSKYQRTAHRVTYAEFSKHQLIARSETERNESPSLPVRSFSLKETMIKKCPEQCKWGSDTWEGFSAYTSQRRGSICNGDQTAQVERLWKGHFHVSCSSGSFKMKTGITATELSTFILRKLLCWKWCISFFLLCQRVVFLWCHFLFVHWLV